MSRKLSNVVFAALCFIWGSTWLGIKLGLEFLPPFIFAGLRFSAATVTLILLAKILHARIPRDRFSWYVMLSLGIFQMTIPYGLVFWGEQYISSGLSAVLFATLPFFVVVFAHWLVNEKLTRLKVSGIVASFTGLVAIFWQEITAQNLVARASFFGSIAIVGSATSGALANVVAKRYAEQIDPAFNVLIQALTCAVALLALGFLTESGVSMSFTATAILAILYLGIVGSALAFVGMYWLFTKMTATNVSLVVFITPILALILGWLVLGEISDPNIGFGTLLIMAGVYMTVKPDSHRNGEK